MMRMLVVVLALAGAACTPEAEDEDAVAGSTLPAPIELGWGTLRAGENLRAGDTRR
jgi:hypothetical protein